MIGTSSGKQYESETDFLMDYHQANDSKPMNQWTDKDWYDAGMAETNKPKPKPDASGYVEDWRGVDMTLEEAKRPTEPQFTIPENATTEDIRKLQEEHDKDPFGDKEFIKKLMDRYDQRDKYLKDLKDKEGSIEGNVQLVADVKLPGVEMLGKGLRGAGGGGNVVPLNRSANENIDASKGHTPIWHPKNPGGPGQINPSAYDEAKIMEGLKLFQVPPAEMKSIQTISPLLDKVFSASKSMTYGEKLSYVKEAVKNPELMKSLKAFYDVDKKGNTLALERIIAHIKKYEH